MRLALFFLIVVSAFATLAEALTVAEARIQAWYDKTVETEGIVTCEADDKYVLEDDTGGITVNHGGCDWHLGDHVRLTGRLNVDSKDSDVNLLALSLTRLGSPGIPAPPEVTPTELQHAPRLTCRRVRVRGAVTEVFRDELDPEWTFLFLEKDGVRIVVAVWTKDDHAEITPALVDAEISLCGLVQSGGGANSRRHIGTYVCAFSHPDLRILRPAPTDAFNETPTLELDLASIRNAVHSGHRHQLLGRVVVCWKRQCLLQTPNGHRLRLVLASDQALPPPDSYITVSGFVRRSLFFTHLTNARWQPCATPSPPLPPDAVTNVTARTILTDNENRPRIQAAFHGRLVRLEGLLQNLYHPTPETTTLLLQNGDHTIEVLADFPIHTLLGARLRVTGACILNEQLPSDGSPFTRLTGFSLVLRSAGDVVVTAQPPWWTPGKFLLILGFLSLVLIGILIWNAFLRKLVIRRGRQLLRETLAHKEADLRTRERMRLAVELHDSIAQNLTGVSLQLDAVSQAYATKAPATGHIIAATKRMLDAACAELRDCLWDLRSNSFDRRDVSAAIRQAIAPHLNAAEAHLALNLPRRKLSDALFHAILSIVRELTINAVRHGKARNVAIRGELKDKTITLSVADDGCGFDPAAAPGISEGHYGLQGIRERLEAFNGTIRFDTANGCGTNVILTLET